MAKVKRSGLGKGLDSLIPFDAEEMNVISHKSRKSASEAEKITEKTGSEAKKNGGVESPEKVGTVTNTNSTNGKTIVEAEKMDAMVRLSLVEPNRSQPRKQFEEES